MERDESVCAASVEGVTGMSPCSRLPGQLDQVKPQLTTQAAAAKDRGRELTKEQPFLRISSQSLTASRLGNLARSGGVTENTKDNNYTRDLSVLSDPTTTSSIYTTVQE